MKGFQNCGAQTPRSRVKWRFCIIRSTRAIVVVSIDHNVVVILYQSAPAVQNQKEEAVAATSVLLVVFDVVAYLH